MPILPLKNDNFWLQLQLLVKAKNKNNFKQDKNRKSFGQFMENKNKK